MLDNQTRGRPRAFDENEVLDQALELFWQRGYQATTTRQLEASLGLSQSSIYNAFGSKYGLLRAAVARYERQITERLLDPLERSEAGFAALDRFFDDLAAWVTSDGRRGCMIINLMAEDGGATDEITSHTRAYRLRVRTALRDALARAWPSAPSSEVEPRTDLLFGVLLGLNIAARGGGDRSEVDRIIAGAHHAIAEWARASGSHEVAGTGTRDGG